VAHGVLRCRERSGRYLGLHPLCGIRGELDFSEFPRSSRKTIGHIVSAPSKNKVAASRSP
jgi:hypothetical protein